MDPKYTNEIVDFLNKTEIRVIEPELICSEYKDDGTREVRIDLGPVCFGRTVQISSNWIVENLLYFYYHEMEKGIVSLQDDIMSVGLIPFRDQHIYLNFASRYQVQNPIITKETAEGLVINRFGKRPTEISDYYLMWNGEYLEKERNSN